jgi:tetratricopeptide (TPR) repeat protein
MTPGNDEEKRREAFRLYEQGQYSESLAICQSFERTRPDPQVTILAARNLYNLGRYEEAEACTRDLMRQMPDSSYLHSLLGRILEKRDEDAAVSEYTRAVILDPGNQEALRSYAAYLVKKGDHRMAIPVLRKIASCSGKEDDFRDLVRSLTASGRPREALALFGKDIRKREMDGDYLDALMDSAMYQEAAREAAAAFRRTRNPALARIQLRALALQNPENAIPDYHEAWRALRDPVIAYDYARLLADHGYTTQALGVCKEVIDSGITSPDQHFRLLICQLNAAAGEKDRALGCFEHLVGEALRKLDDPASLGELLTSYREFLLTYFPVSFSLPRFLGLVAGTPNVVCLLATASFFENIGDTGEARSAFYRAFRSDFLTGGMEYARFLARTNDLREAEKILLHVLANVRKIHDLEEVAGLILDERWKLYRQKRLLDRLILLLEGKGPLLGSAGLECLSVACLVSASAALREGDFLRCKENCLRGLDAVPVVSTHIRPHDFLDLIGSCKEEALCDLPVIEARREPEERDEHRAAVEKFLEECDDQEREIIEYLIEHKEAREMDLRRLLDTRRVVGIVNRIIQKSAAKGLVIIEKKGSGEGGEIYAYVPG